MMYCYCMNRVRVYVVMAVIQSYTLHSREQWQRRHCQNLYISRIKDKKREREMRATNADRLFECSALSLCHFTWSRRTDFSLLLLIFYAFPRHRDRTVWYGRRVYEIRECGMCVCPSALCMKNHRQTTQQNKYSKNKFPFCVTWMS